MRIETREASKWVKCVSCGEMVRTCEKYLQVVNSRGNDVRGEKYCLGCEDYAYENNPEINGAPDEREPDGEEHLRRMEAYAEYQYNGNTSAYWDDLNGGYIR